MDVIYIDKDIEKIIKNKKIEIKNTERIDDLQYNGLYIIQDKRKFCFGIDSILITDFAKDIKKGTSLMDIGSGTGIISILCQKKYNLSNVTGVEIQSDMAEMSKRSVMLNNLENNISILNCNIKDVLKYVKKNSFDYVITNPPYKKKDDGIKNINSNKLISRHEVECELKDILENSYKILKDNGSIYIVHRPERLVDLLYQLRLCKLEPKKIRFVFSKYNESPVLVMIKAKKNGGSFLKIDKNLVIYDENGKYTNEILKIYGKNLNSEGID